MTYPQTNPGFKGAIETGREAAFAFAPKLGKRQAEVLADLAAHGPSTAEEIGARIDRHWYLVRPRISELKALGLVIDTGGRAKSALGGKTHQVRLTTPDERARFAAAKEAAEAAGGDE